MNVSPSIAKSIAACIIEVKNGRRSMRTRGTSQARYLRLFPGGAAAPAAAGNGAARRGVLVLGGELHSRNRMSRYLFHPDFLVQIGHHAILREKSMPPRRRTPTVCSRRYVDIVYRGEEGGPRHRARADAQVQPSESRLSRRLFSQLLIDE